MKAQILQENLLKSLVRTGRVISQRAQLPVLQNVLIKTEDGLLRITATNLETTITTLAGAKVEKEGGLCVPAKTLTELVSSLPQESVLLTEKDGSLEVETSRVHAAIPGIAAGEFPALMLSGSEKGSKLSWATFRDALGLVLFCAATDEGRPLLTGVKIRKDGDDLLFAATDGYRLSVKRMPHAAKHDLDMVVPARALGELYRLLLEEKEGKEGKDGKKEGQTVLLERSGDGQLLFGVGDTRIATRVIDGQYPDFERIIPKSFHTSVRFDREELLRAVKSASIFARDSANILKLHLGRDAIIVSANTPQVGQNTVSVDASAEGEEGDIAFNSRFLLDLLGNVSVRAELVFQMTGSLNPGLFRMPDDESFLHVIMPVRVAAES